MNYSQIKMVELLVIVIAIHMPLLGKYIEMVNDYISILMVPHFSPNG